MGRARTKRFPRFSSSLPIVSRQAWERLMFPPFSIVVFSYEYTIGGSFSFRIVIPRVYFNLKFPFSPQEVLVAVLGGGMRTTPLTSETCTSIRKANDTCIDRFGSVWLNRAHTLRSGTVDGLPSPAGK